MWQVKLNRPVAYQWAPHMPEIPIPSAHRIQPELYRVTKTLSFSIRLPFHLQNGIECKIDIELRYKHDNHLCNVGSPAQA